MESEFPDRSYRVVPTDADTGARIDRVLAAALPDLSRTRLKQLIERGCVRAGGATITEPSHRVKPGEAIEVGVPAPEPATPAGEAIGLDIVYEDADLLVLNKPAGLVVHPAPGSPAGTLVNALIAHCGDSLSGIGGVRRPGIVHRLDKDTSGLMVVAKTDVAHAALSADLKERRVERAYLALVWGVPVPSKGEIEGNIGRSPRNRKKMAVLNAGGKTALTRYTVLRRFGTVASLVECRLATGRTHQIRVHMTHIGHPVIGDIAYGGGLTPKRRTAVGAEAADHIAGLNRQALHARLLGFRHPATAESLTFEQDFPNELSVLQTLLENV